jgi:hypothetical protein
MSRQEIRNKAKAIRLAYGIDKNIHLDVVRFLEHIIPDMYPDVSIDFIEKFEGEKGKCGEYDFLENTIRIPEGRYIKAQQGDGRARYDIAHECSHKILITPRSLTLCRFERNLKPFEDPEWQADCLAGELLMPYDLIKGMSVEEVDLNCGVTMAAAKYQLSKI